MKVKLPGGRTSALLLTVALVVTLTACVQRGVQPAIEADSVKELSVFAGSASKPPLDEAAALFTRQTGTKIFITYGGSGSVLSQMKLSKSGDVYIPGSPDFMVKAETDGQVIAGTSRIIAYLVPAINVPKGNPAKIQALNDLTRPGLKIAIGHPVNVCVGTYAIELLEYNRLLEAVFPRIITQADSCDRVAALAALSAVEAVIGWDVFHAWNPDLIDTILIQPGQLPRLAFIPAAVSTYTRSRPAAERFITFLASAEGRVIFKKWGYHVTEEEVRQFAPQAAIGGDYQLPESYHKLLR